MGSEMCIRDRFRNGFFEFNPAKTNAFGDISVPNWVAFAPPLRTCLLYTSDAADDLLCVDLGGRRIIKKKKTIYKHI